MLSTFKGKVAAVIGLASFLAMQVAATAGAVATYDISDLTGGVVDQVQASLTTILPIAGGLLALGVAFRLVRRMVKA